MSKKKTQKQDTTNQANRKRLLISATIFFISVFTIAKLNELMFHPEGGLSLWQASSFFIYRNIRVVFVLALLLSTIGVLLWGVVRSNLSEKIKGISLTISALFLLLLVAELFFSFYARTNGVDNVWSQILWSHKYWEPERISLPDSTFINLRNDGSKLDIKKKKIFTVGDSFTGGDGIENPKQTYTSMLRGLLESKYPNEYSVVNLGERGADTYKEAQNLRGFSYVTAKKEAVSMNQIKPKLIVWQYYGNDVDYTAKNMGVLPQYDESFSDRFFRAVFQEHFFVTDYLYWHLMKRSDEEGYIKFLKKCYSGEIMKTPDGKEANIKATHFEPIRMQHGACLKDTVEFMLVIFPFMNNIPLSEELYANEIEQVCLQSNVHVINLCKLFKPYSTQELIVSNDNPHPSILAHKLAADTIYNYAVAHKLLE